MRERDAGDWVAFVDADEVHGHGRRTIARHLASSPPAYDFVDGYTWHFFQSFDYYTSIERRMMFFRYRPAFGGRGPCTSTCSGLDGKRIALPYMYAHYGHTLAPRRHAEKGRHYSSLGAPGNVLREDELDSFDVVRYFKPVYPKLLRFAGTHPPAAGATLDCLRASLRSDHDLTARVAASQPASVKLRNVLRKLDYELRWRARTLDPSARGWSHRGSAPDSSAKSMIKKVYLLGRGASLLTAPRKL